MQIFTAGILAALSYVMVKRIPFELLFWVTAIIALAVSNPLQPHYSLCIFRFLGWQHCPGCGLGHSISFLLQGNIVASWQNHPLGIFATVVIFQRIAALSTPYYLLFKKIYRHGY